MFKILLIFFSFFILNITKFYAQIPQNNLILWLSADSVEIVDNKVATWYDKSGNDFHLTQENATKRPLRIDSVLNNLPAISFNGSATSLRCAFGITFAQPNSFFIVHKIKNGSNQVIFDGISSERSFFQYYSGRLKLRSLTDNTVFYNMSVPTQFILNTLVYNSPNSQLFEFGELKSSGNSGNLGCDGINLGSSLENTAYFNGDIAEIIFYDTVLSDNERILIESYLSGKYAPPLTLGSDISVLYGFCDTLLYIDSHYSDIVWSTGETSNTIYVNQSGQYWVQATGTFGRVVSDTINVQFPNPNFQNSNICLGDSVLYQVELDGSYNYLWYDADTESSKYFKDAGDYWLRIEDSFGCFDTVFFSVSVDSFKNKISLGNDTFLCIGNTIRLIEGEELCTSFLWSPSENNSASEIVNESGWYKLEVYNENSCYASDSIYVNILGTAPNPDYFVENICLGDTTIFIDNSTPVSDIANWKWIINENDTIFSQNAEYVFENIGVQQIELIVESFSGCANNIEFQIEILPVPEVSFTHYPACTNTELNFISSVSVPSETFITNYSWLIDGVEMSDQADFTHIYPSNGLYLTEFNIVLNNGCSASFVETIEVLNQYPEPTFLSLVLPKNNSVILDNEITFKWNIANDAILYQLLISNDIDFLDIIFASELLITNEYVFEIPDSIVSLYWKVVAFNSCLVAKASSIYFCHKFDSSNEHLKLWLAADNVSVVDNKINIWCDMSGNQFDLLQNNTIKQPVKIDSAINNLPVIRFNGSTTSMSCAFETTFAQPNSFFIIHKIKNGSNQVIFDGVSSERSLLQYYSGRLKLRSLTDNAVFYDISVPTQFMQNTLVYNSPNSQLFESGTLKSSGNSGNLGCDGIILGSSLENTAYLNGDIAEVIFYDTVLSDNDRIRVERYLHDKYSPPLSLGYDIRVPYGFCDTAISAYKPWFTSYLWSTGETDSIIYVNKPGLYSCTVTDIFGFESSDDIRVFYPPVNNFADTIACYGNSVIWDAELRGDYTYQWLGSTETSREITISQEGDYSLIITDSLGCKYYSDTINFSFDNYEFTASIGPADTSLCVGNRLSLITNSEETVEYLWSSGEESPEIALFESGTYSVTTTNWRGCEAKDEISVIITGTVPIPDFSVLGHCAKNIISFSDLSTSQDGNINYWRWSVNGEEFANSQNSEIILEEAGIYNINLEIKTDADCGDYLIKNIEVFPLPKPNFSPDYYCQWAEIDFKAISTIETGNVENNYWKINDFEDFGDSITYIFENSGFNTVKLISESEQACKDSIIQEVFVKQAQKPEFLAENTCVNTELSFVNITNIDSHNLPISWIWDFGDENFGENSDPSHIYVNPGIYNVNLSVIWQNMCETSINKEIEVYANPELELLIENYCLDTKFKVQTNINSESGEITEYLWSFNGKEYSSNSEISPNFICDSVGEYPISLEIKSEYGCKAFAQDSLKIYPLPQVDFAVSRDWGGFPFLVEFTNLSQGANQYLWTFGDLESSTEENPSHIYNSEAEFLVSLLGISEYGCFASAEKKIISVNPIMDLILYNLRTKLNGNYLEISVYIINNGTLPVTQPELILNLGDGKVYRESLEEIQAGEVLDYKLKTEIWRAEKTLPEIICLEIFANPFEGHYETKTEDNLICAGNVKNLVLFLPYPNPASQSITVEYVLSKATDCVVRLINSMGEKVYEIKFTEKDLHNKFEINVEEFASGVYYLQVIAGEEQENRKIILR